MDIFPLSIFYNPDSITNILSFGNVNSQFIITMDTNNKPAIFIHTGLDYSPKFYQCHEVLYYFDTSVPNIFSPSGNAYSFRTTVQEKKSFSWSQNWRSRWCQNSTTRYWIPFQNEI